MCRFPCIISPGAISRVVSNLSAQRARTGEVTALITYSGTLSPPGSGAIPSVDDRESDPRDLQAAGGRASVWMETRNVTVDDSSHYSDLVAVRGRRIYPAPCSRPGGVRVGRSCRRTAREGEGDDSERAVRLQGAARRDAGRTHIVSLCEPGIAASFKHRQLRGRHNN
jgi:hypothetical protein